MNYYSLTHPQKRIWYMENIYNDTPMHNIGGQVQIHGDLNHDIIEQAIQNFISNHDGVRLQLTEINGEINQYVSENILQDIERFDFSNSLNPEYEFSQWQEKKISELFNLVDSPLYYFAIYKLGPRKHGYFVKFHHIIADGWSIQIMTDQISQFYKDLVAGNTPLLIDKPSYIQYSNREIEYKVSKRYQKDKEFWNEKYKLIPESINRRKNLSLKGKRKSFSLGKEYTEKILEFTGKEEITLNSFFITLYMLYSYKMTDNSDISIGIPVLNRSGKKEKGIFGMFTGTIPFRFKLDNNLDIGMLFKQIQKELRACYIHQKYPYDLLCQDLELNKNGYEGLFDVSINYYGTSLTKEFSDFKLENIEFYNGYQWYYLQIIIREWEDTISLEFDYNIEQYSEKEIDRIFYRFIYLAEQLMSNTSETIESIDVLPRKEKKYLLECNSDSENYYPKEKTFSQLFEEQVNLTPSKIAICDGKQELTFFELNRRANKLANFLLEKGIEKESIIGIMSEHSFETIIAILATHKVGAAYLPIDPSYPKERIQYILEESMVKLLLTNVEQGEQVKFKGEVLSLNKDFNKYCDTNPLVQLQSNLLAYVIYTSGSTGNPKGIMIEQKGLVNYLYWAKQKYVKSSHEVFPLFTSLAFDLTVTSIFLPLISGGCIEIYRDDKEEYVLYRIIEDKKATIIKLTPSHLSLLRDCPYKSSSIKRFIVGGEDLKTTLAKEVYELFDEKVEIFNEYGPSETVVGCMIHKFDQNDNRNSVPIGKQINNMKLYILDEKLNPTPISSIGELYVTGEGLMRGYIGSNSNKNVILDNPFINGERMYKTGDLVRRTEDGIIEFIGRKDQQIHLKGYRIELGEIESTLCKHPDIQDAVVMDVDIRGEKLICAYIILNDAVEKKDITDFLLKYLPKYMIPSHYIPLEKFKLTSNGKVDRKQLPIPNREEYLNDYQKKELSKKENILIETIKEVLDIESIKLTDSFYYLGGDSIKAIQVSSRMRQKNLKISVNNILLNPIFQDMFNYVEDSTVKETQAIPSSGAIITPPVVSWFFEQNLMNFNHYNQSVLLDLKKDITIKELESTLTDLVRIHDSLRLNYEFEKMKLFYNENHLNSRVNLIAYDLSDLSPEMQKKKIDEYGYKLKSGFDIEAGLLFKACLFICGNKKKLLLTSHHLVVDAVSWEIILDDLDELIAFRNDLKIINRMGDSYQKWGEALFQYSKTEAIKELSYWQDILTNDFKIFKNKEEPSKSVSIVTKRAELESSITDKLFYAANQTFNTTPKDLLITALGLTLREVTEQSKIMIELEGHGREDILEGVDISRTVGWFTSIFPVNIEINGTNLSTEIKNVKEQLRKIPYNGIGYNILRYLSKLQVHYDSTNLVRLNFLGEISRSSSRQTFDIIDESTGEDIHKNNDISTALEINAMKLSNNLVFEFKYNPSKMGEELFSEIENKFMFYIKEIIDYCCKKDVVEYTPSDFDTLSLSQEELNHILGISE